MWYISVRFRLNVVNHIRVDQNTVLSFELNFKNLVLQTQTFSNVKNGNSRTTTINFRKTRNTQLLSFSKLRIHIWLLKSLKRMFIFVEQHIIIVWKHSRKGYAFVLEHLHVCIRHVICFCFLWLFFDENNKRITENCV